MNIFRVSNLQRWQRKILRSGTAHVLPFGAMSTTNEVKEETLKYEGKGLLYDSYDGVVVVNDF